MRVSTVSCMVLAAICSATAQTASEAVKAVEVSQAAGAAPVVANATAASPSLADVRALLVQNKIIPEVLDDFQPSVGISVAYAKAVPIGSHVVWTDAADAPTVTLTGAKADKLYTLVMTDPGVLNADSKATSAWQWLHWIVVNVQGNGLVTEGEVVEPYSGPNPPKGDHRYVFLAFEQPKLFHYPTPADRGAFDTRAFAAQNGLTPVGSTFFYCLKQA
jgi:phosphatidylethanolamine-binding protein